MEELRKRTALLASAAKRYIRFPLGEVEYQMIAHDLAHLSGAQYAVINLYSKENSVTVTRGIACSSKLLDKAQQMIGYPLMERSWALDDFARKSFLSETTSYCGDLHSVVAGHMSEELGLKMEHVFNIRAVWAVALRDGENILGNLMMIMELGSQAPEIQLVDIFAELVVQILQRKETEKQLKAALDAKKLILRESHHRIKNNLALVAGLVSLQEELLPQDYAEILRPVSRRINAIALIHEQLQNAGDEGSSIRFADYLKRLVEELQDSFWSDETRIYIDIERADGIVLSDDKAISLGIIVTELVMNSIKHAFQGREQGSIRINLLEDGDTIELSIGDDGIGFQEKEEEKEKDSSSIGLMLVHSLVDQLQGGMEKRNQAQSSGALVQIRFPR